jgi:hypothetical protein
MKALKKEETDVRLIPGKDYFLYSRDNEVIVSTEKETKSLIGGFHTLCADAGAIPGHPLSGYMAGDILPQSLWNLRHRARCGNNNGMVYDPDTKLWVDIYLPSGIDENTTSVYNGKISNDRYYKDFIADAKKIKKRLLTHEEFTSAATGSNEITNITGSSFPGSTGGHIDQLGRRMISNIGCEDMCGVVWQWLSTPDPVYDYCMLLAGGNWDDGASSGSRYRYTGAARADTGTTIGARFVAEPL